MVRVFFEGGGLWGGGGGTSKMTPLNVCKFKMAAHVDLKHNN